jgi:hypothetical protein
MLINVPNYHGPSTPAALPNAEILIAPCRLNLPPLELPHRVTHWTRLLKSICIFPHRYVFSELVTVVMDTRYNYHVTDQYPIACDRKAKPVRRLGRPSHVQNWLHYLGLIFIPTQGVLPPEIRALTSRTLE